MTLAKRRAPWGAGLMLLGLLGGCTSYQYAKNVTLASYDDDIGKGDAVGPVRGADCMWTVLGVTLGDQPTLDRAMANARNQRGEGVTDGLEEADASKELRYINGMSTEWDGFDAGVVSKQCLVVKGAGFK